MDEETSLLLADNGNGGDTSASSPLQPETYESLGPKEVEDLEDEEEEEGEDEDMPFLTITCILSSAFSYGCILTTLFMITLPIECERIQKDHPTIPKSVALGAFVCIAGVTQLVSPILGRLSDMYIPPNITTTTKEDIIGQRLPYFILGSICTVIGLLGQMLASYSGFWVRYGFAFFLHMIGLNIMYAMMLALIPDQVPSHQTGVANGILALLLVIGSLFGFGLFHSFLSERIQNMYGLYTCIVIVSAILTGTHAHERDAERAFQRLERRESLKAVRQQEAAARKERLLRAKTKAAQESVVSPALTGGDLKRYRRRKRRVKWHRAAKKAAKKAHEIVITTPSVLLRTMLVDPFQRMDAATLCGSYTIDVEMYHDFFVVTVSRLFYYCGMSVQTFFLYFLQDVIGVHKDPESMVAILAILGQCSGALTCYPVGVMSDRLFNGRRKPFVYFACVLLSSVTLALLWARNVKEMAIFCLILVRQEKQR